MNSFKGVITKYSEGYNEYSNSFTINHSVVGIDAVPYSISKKDSEGNYEAIEVKDVVFKEGKIVIYFGSMTLSDDDRIAFVFNVLFENEYSNSEDFDWEQASKDAYFAKPCSVQYSINGVSWSNENNNAKYIRISRDSGSTWETLRLA